MTWELKAAATASSGGVARLPSSASMETTGGDGGNAERDGSFGRDRDAEL